MKFTGPKAKVCRRFGTNIYGSDKYDAILQRKPQPAGKGPRDRLGRKSEFAQQLMEKQKMRMIYGLSERQFKSIYKKAASTKGKPTGDSMKEMLEKRLDNVLYRAGFAKTRLQARQFVSHGLFLVNGIRVTVPSYSVQEGDVVALRDRNKGSSIFADIVAAHEKYMAPDWIKANSSSLSAEIISTPSAEAAEQAVDIRQVIEFYSRN
ncbi:30S ribosomal protein S4 [Candidatus Peregrinibacteria bacterium]|jgi:small subunit ribosomal protein S4|nr:30S ribosomal protein S4 [Candidatus Peregrinibacteria bacterium]MBT3599096.1 30S ribosomal protein S4 [Candidatus Peregrinibacteria bacterium]MBT4367669.1 30S ribosomal protein S4 [Candidatus Peregrinibacteria bacterium]MBT4585447.1 30S ribosomal protein S4 [Candidatus Peregrinibacteria bacterium]MBT6730402.1 30S ribosomal protein S4 [Candidatus Peregrinibacteria bacterium]